MAKRSDAGERLAALETELPHVWQHVHETRNAINALSAELATLRVTMSKYAQTGLLLATAGLVHAVSGSSSQFAAELLKIAFGIFIK